MGPSPSAVVSGPVNSSTAASKSHSSSGISGELGELVRASWLAQNSSAKPFDATTNPAGASVGPPADRAGPLPPITNSEGAAHSATIERTLSNFKFRLLGGSGAQLSMVDRPWQIPPRVRRGVWGGRIPPDSIGAADSLRRAGRRAVELRSIKRSSGGLDAHDSRNNVPT